MMEYAANQARMVMRIQDEYKSANSKLKRRNYDSLCNQCIWRAIQGNLTGCQKGSHFDHLLSIIVGGRKYFEDNQCWA